MENERYKLSGLNCGHCVNSVKTALEKLNGVSSVQVNLENQMAEVTFDGAQVSEADFKKAVEEEGFGFLGQE